jgi:uroporphyrinogen-III decarboxylase
VVRTPLGTLEEHSQFLPEPCTWATTKHMVESVDDLAMLRYWREHTTYTPDYQEAIRRAELVRDLGVVLCYLPRSPFMELTAVLAGIANIVDMWMEAPDAFDETLAVMNEAADRAAEVAVAVPADCLMIPENLSSEVVGRRFYEQYVQPWESRWVERIAATGKASFIHMDGTLGGLLPRVAETGFDVIEAATPAPVGDLPVEEWRELAGPEPILWGGVPGIYFTALVDDAEFERHVRSVLEVMVEDRRMVLGVADQVPPDGLRQRVAAVSELVERYGRYA